MSRTDFTLVAPIYRWLEYLVFGKALQRSRVALLDNLTGSECALILGDGDGRFTAEYVRRHRTGKVRFLDSSPGMMRLARKRIQHLGLTAERVDFRLQDIRSGVDGGPYDLVVTHYFLDCFSEPELASLVQTLADQTTADANWLVSEFSLPENRLGRAFGRILIRVMYLFFRIVAGVIPTELPGYAKVLKLAGFDCIKHKPAGGGLLVSELWKRRAPDQDARSSIT